MRAVLGGGGGVALGLRLILRVVMCQALPILLLLFRYLQDTHSHSRALLHKYVGWHNVKCELETFTHLPVNGIIKAVLVWRLSPQWKPHNEP